MDHVPAAPGAAPVDPARARRYAEALVDECLLLADGDALVIFCEPAHRQLAVEVVAAAARAGARSAKVLYEDPAARRAFLLDAVEERIGTMLDWEHALRHELIAPDVALLQITGPEVPGLLDDVPGALQGLEISRRVATMPYWGEANAAGRVRFLIAAWPTTAWAARVYPELPPAEAAGRMLDDVLACARLAPHDPPGAITAHAADLARRAALVEGLALDRLRFDGPGTALDVGLLPGSAWWHVGRPDGYGVPTIVNWPSEELFTSPDPRRVHGPFRCSRPLEFLGREITGLHGEIVDGRLVHLDSDDPGGAEAVLGYLDVDEGGRGVGEVALVDTSSRVWQTGRTFSDTLFDENAACHIAFGFGFDFTAADDAQRARINRASAHLDVMIGSEDVTVTGVRGDGAAVTLIEGGRWRI